MAKEFSRSLRVAEQIRRELAELIRLELKDPRVRMVSLTDVEVTPDYAHAKIFFTCMTGEEGAAEVLRGLRHSAGFLRRELGRKVRIHTLPELHFEFDRSVENGSRLSALIDRTVAEDRERSGESADEAQGGGEDESSGR